MNYRKIYSSIIRNAKKERHLEYYEVHHIIPRSYGGSNKSHNLVKLSLREHFLVHLILCKMYPNCLKMKRAFNLMYYKVAKNSKKYEWVRKIYHYNIKKEDLSNIMINNPGISKSGIAKIFGCDVSVIQSRLTQYELTYEKLNLDNAREFIKNNKHLTLPQIGLQFNVSGALISKYNQMYDLGLLIRTTKRNSDFDINTINNLINNKMNNTQIANMLSVSVDKVRSLLIYYGLSNPNINTTHIENFNENEIIQFIIQNDVDTKKEVCNIFNIGYTKLTQIIKRNKLTLKMRTFDLYEVKTYILNNPSTTITDVANEFDFGWDKTSLYLKKNKLL